MQFVEGQDHVTPTVQQFVDMAANHSYAILEPSPRPPPPHLQSGSGGSCVGCDQDQEVVSWQYTMPASAKDELLLQLKELAVREIFLDQLQ